MALSHIRRPLSTLPASLSFWVTDEPITLNQLDSAESLLVKIYKDFLDLYVAKGTTYRNFWKRALKERSSVSINYKIAPQSVNKVVAAYSRVYDVLKEHRQQVIEAYTRKSGFDNEAALLLLAHCELRSFKGEKPTSPKHPDISDYEAFAKCANDFGVFNTQISGSDIIGLRDGTLKIPLSAPNMSRAVFFLSLLEKLYYLPRDWKNRAATNGMLAYSKTGKSPSLHYLHILADRNNAGQYLADTSSSKYFSRESFYQRITRAVRDVVSRKK